ncbi:polyprenyl synthetase family protein [Rubrivirga sp. IMCC45206]|uniref:polyprenyl synthetase family protein n=1 Tax=Rubrivirga sp. IMCC45206 TaxID=3391614 RepID=UPI0039901121
MPDTLAPPLTAAPLSLKAIQAPVAGELKTFRAHFRDAMRSRVRLLDTVVQYLLRRKGKQIRPTLVLLAADLVGGIGERSFRAATLVELLHTATLVHDDVVDEAETRRGVASINALWRNKVGVLLGDYLLSRGLLLALDDGDYDLLHITSDAVRRMSEGELLQIETARRLDMTEARYFQIIADKTGSLIAACLAAGAASAGADDATVARCKAIGETIGLAFQIRDDLFDYDPNAAAGKPVGLDLQDRKLTLPLILALDRAEPAVAKRIRKIVRRRKKSAAEVAEVVAFVEASGGLAAARGRMEALAAEAADGLLAFPPSDARDALVGLCAYVVARKR